MPTISAALSPLVYQVECEDGRRYVVYNAAALGNPADHVADRWYARPYPVPTPLRGDFSEPFESAEEAVQAARARHVRVDGFPRST